MIGARISYQTIRQWCWNWGKIPLNGFLIKKIITTNYSSLTKIFLKQK
jgi:hypothetical protein